MPDPGERMRKHWPQAGLLIVATMVAGLPPAAAAKSPAPATSAGAPAEWMWQAVAKHPEGVVEGAVQALHRGKLYVGESPLYVFEPASNTWRKLASAPTPGRSAASAFIGDRFYVAGGVGTDWEIVGDLKIYDSVTDSWSAGPPMPHPVFDATGTALGGKLYVVGGCDNWYVCGIPDLQIYDPATRTWELSYYPEPAFAVACGVIREVLYCAGGIWDDMPATETEFFDSTYSYDPTAGSWTRRANVPSQMGTLNSGAAGGLLVIPHGYWPGFGSLREEAFAYDPVTDSWRTYPPIGQGSYSPGTAFCLSRSSGTTVEVLTGFTDCDR